MPERVVTLQDVRDQIGLGGRHDLRAGLVGDRDLLAGLNVDDLADPEQRHHRSLVGEGLVALHVLHHRDVGTPIAVERNGCSGVCGWTPCEFACLMTWSIPTIFAVSTAGTFRDINSESRALMLPRKRSSKSWGQMPAPTPKSVGLSCSVLARVMVWFLSAASKTYGLKDEPGWRAPSATTSNAPLMPRS